MVEKMRDGMIREMEIINYVILAGEMIRIDTVGAGKEEQVKRQLSKRAEKLIKKYTVAFSKVPETGIENPPL